CQWGGRHLDSIPGSNSFCGATSGGYTPDVTAVYVADVTRIKQRLAIGGDVECLERSFAGSEFDRRGRSAVHAYGVIANPLFGLLLEDQVIASPRDLIDVGKGSRVRLVVPDFANAVRGDIHCHE